MMNCLKRRRRLFDSGKLFAVVKIIRKPLMTDASNAVLFKFREKNSVVDSIKGFGKSIKTLIEDSLSERH